jgi:catechol 2,3-dioxygenase-like lactoylglutathione lyase family enzyme
MKFEFSPYVAFQVKNYDKAIDFYKNVLGWNLVKTDSNETHFQSGIMNFFAESNDKGFTFFEFKTDNMKEAKVLLEKNGCVITQVYDDKSMMFKDPYGMCFHIFED